MKTKIFFNIFFLFIIVIIFFFVCVDYKPIFIFRQVHLFESKVQFFRASMITEKCIYIYRQEWKKFICKILPAPVRNKKKKMITNSSTTWVFILMQYSRCFEKCLRIFYSKMLIKFSGSSLLIYRSNIISQI